MENGVMQQGALCKTSKICASTVTPHFSLVLLQSRNRSFSSILSDLDTYRTLLFFSRRSFNSFFPTHEDLIISCDLRTEINQLLLHLTKSSVISMTKCEFLAAKGASNQVDSSNTTHGGTCAEAEDNLIVHDVPMICLPCLFNAPIMMLRDASVQARIRV
jgi:hypothetical protein